MTTLNRDNFGLATHKVKVFEAVVPTGLTKEDLEKSELWHNVARALNIDDGASHIHIIAEDYSFYAYGIVTFARGSDAMVKIVNFAQLDSVVEINDPLSAYKIKQKGRLKWCVVKDDIENGEEIIQDKIPTQGAAQKALDDYLKALRQ